jgi:DnaJ-class molecular chaperone
MGGLGGIGGMGGMGGMGGTGGPRIIIRTFGPGGESITENIMGSGGGSGSVGGHINMNDPFGILNEMMHHGIHGMHGGHNQHHMNTSPPPHQEMHSYEIPRTPRFQHKAEPKPPLISVNVTVTLEHVCQGATIPVEMERWNINSEGVHELSNHVEYISVPKGAETGEVILLSNRGNENATGIRGDVKVTIIVEEHELFKRTGLDILIEKKISLKDALCGFVFDIEHVNGKKFSFNSSPGNIIKDGLIKTIPRLGLQKGNDSGNLNVVFRVIYPDKLSEEQIKILGDTL